MKISLNWIKQFTDVNLSTEELIDRINKRLGGTEGWEDLSERYQGILVAKVVSCEKHPNADKLKICKIDDGGKADVERDEDGNVQVVCGAPNVKEGMMVAWIPPGATVPATFTDIEPLTLDARELRGEVSNGMLASGKELGLNNDHSGILEIDKTAETGQDFVQVYELDDTIIEIENKMFTNRPDCFGVIGVAREIAGIQEINFVSPKWYTDLDQEISSGTALKVQVDNQVPDLAPRVTFLAFEGVTIKPSPVQVQSYLARVGVKPINNVVDVTNFVSVLVAQPMHAFDYDKVASLSSSDFPNFVVRKAVDGDELELLDGRKVKPNKDTVLICTDQKALSIAGAMGGIGSEVDENTTRIVLEAANFNLYSVRRTSMKHGIFTDAVTRFSKGQSIAQIKPAVAFASDMLKQNASAQAASSFVDDYQSSVKSLQVEVAPDFINSRLGSDFTSEQIAEILNRTELKTVPKDDKLVVNVPFWRNDLHEKEDIVEEVGRLYGYDNLELSLPMVSVDPSDIGQSLKTARMVRSKLTSLGANEFMTHAFVSQDLMQKTGQDLAQAHKIRNALSPELNYYRIVGMPSLISRIHANQKQGFGTLAVFEVTKLHNRVDVLDGNLPIERQVTSFVYSSNNDNLTSSPYFTAKYYLAQLLADVHPDVEYKKLDKVALDNTWLVNLSKLFTLERSAAVWVSDQVIGIVGEFKTQIRRDFKLPKDTAGFELDNRVFDQYGSKKTYQRLSRYPTSEVDVTYETSTDVSFSMVKNSIDSSAQTDSIKVEVTPLDIFKPEDSEVLRYSFRLKLTSFEATLTSESVQKLLQRLDKNLTEQISATRI